MEYKVSELMDRFRDGDYSPAPPPAVSAQRVKELTVGNIAAAPRARRPRRALRTALLAAAFAAALSVTAYAAYQARIDDYLLPEATAAPTAAAETAVPTAAPRRISLVGYQGTPEYEAYVAWDRWREENPVDWSQYEGNDAYTETPENYAYIYGAPIQAQAEALDRIAQEHGLTLHEHWGHFEYDETQQLYDALGTEPFAGAEGAGYVFDDGSFKLETGDMSMFVSVKGSFTMISNSVGEDYEEWSYETKSGQAADLVLERSGRAHVLCETEGAYIHACGTPEEAGRAGAEAFAESIGLDILEKRYDGSAHPDTARAVAAMEEQDRTQAAATMADNWAPFGSREEMTAAILEDLGDWRMETLPAGWKYLWCNPDWSDGDSWPLWDMENACYCAGIVAGYSVGEDSFVILAYARNYTDGTRTQSATAGQFRAAREYFAQDHDDFPVPDSFHSTALQPVTVNGYEGFAGAFPELGGMMVEWYDTDRDLVFQLTEQVFSGEGMTAEALTAIAETYAESLG